MQNIPKAVQDLYEKIPKFSDCRIDYTNAKKAAVLTCFVDYLSRTSKTT